MGIFDFFDAVLPAEVEIHKEAQTWATELASKLAHHEGSVKARGRAILAALTESYQKGFQEGSKLRKEGDE